MSESKDSAALDPFTAGDQVARLIERLIVDAERQIKGVESGGERHRAVVDAVMSAVKLPAMNSRETASYMVQVLYHHIAKDVAPRLRSSE